MALIALALAPSLIGLLPERLRGSRLAGSITGLAAVLPLIARPRNAFVGVVAALAGHLIVAAALFSAVRATGAMLAGTDAIVVLPAILLLTALPISIAGWGVREAGMTLGLGSTGVPAEFALLASLLIGLMMILVHAPAGIMLFRDAGK
jgi:hypothetical protein